VSLYALAPRAHAVARDKTPRMKAILAHQFGPVDALRVEERPDPTPGRGEIVIEVVAAAINFPDVLVIEGLYQVRPPLPFIPGKELSGVVSAVGPDVSNYRIGDRVMALVEYGAFCERIAVPIHLCFPVPDWVELESAAAVGIAYQTAHFALHHRGGARRGEAVMVTAANGSVGLAAIQLAKAAGADVIAIVSDASKRQIVLDNGADHALVSDAGQPFERFREAVRQSTHGRGIDLLIDSAGGAIFESCLRTVAWEGRAVIVGFTTGTIPCVRTNYLLVKNISLIGLQWSDYRDRDPAYVAKVQNEIFDKFQNKQLHAQIMATFPMSKFAEAFKLLMSRQTRGKVLLTMRRPDHFRAECAS
jgi:NADPH2:quinone reductase